MSFDKTAIAEMARYQRMRRAVLAIIILFLGVVLIFGRSRQGEVVHNGIEHYGVILILIGIGGRLWSTLYIGGRKSAEVVSTGPYSIMRNPLYFFSSIAAGGAGAQMGSYVAMFGLAALCAIAFYVVTLREERYLTAKLGANYQEYRTRVPRFFPNPFLYRDQPEVTFEPKLLKQTLLDGLIFFISIPLFEFVEAGQQAGIIPVFFQMH